MPTLRVKHLTDLDKINYSRDGDAALDLRASSKFVINLDEEKKEIEQDSYLINPGERILVKTGIQVAIPKNHWGNIKDRSGNAFNHGIHVLGGVIDENYRGEIGVVLVNLSKKEFKINKNDRIAQMIISEYKKVDIEHVDELDETNRNKDGFGSTGK